MYGEATESGVADLAIGRALWDLNVGRARAGRDAGVWPASAWGEVIGVRGAGIGAPPSGDADVLFPTDRVVFAFFAGGLAGSRVATAGA